ncbi:hypothetical protein A3E41_02330 [Candidatus Woesebacteria bacterium RIFCSPHIGHO2_12_FULL_38_9]|nr:MAG: hypothetical protein A3E41_02330 [Candidatus Woesebacteria bacterium RIFCSPHIGHO2_12_FULL_38_9]
MIFRFFVLGIFKIIISEIIQQNTIIINLFIGENTKFIVIMKFTIPKPTPNPNINFSKMLYFGTNTETNKQPKINMDILNILFSQNNQPLFAAV